MTKPRYLTKSRFKLGCECPSKLYFTSNPLYGSTQTDDSFLAALAEGGFQIGELAKLYNPGGIEIETLEHTEAEALTKHQLDKDRVVIYEAALRVRNLFVRVDILRKDQNRVDLVEVKAKSFDSSESNLFWNNKNKGLVSRWEPYLLDIAFQTYVARLAYPEWEISPYLMLADKNAKSTVEGLNQRFGIENINGQVRAVVSESARSADLGAPILKEIDVSAEVNFIHREWEAYGKSFEELVEWLANAYASETMLKVGVAARCKSCEFRIDDNLKKQGLRSGFEKCWTSQMKVSGEDFKRPFVFDIWKYRLSDRKIHEGVYFMDEIDPEEFGDTDVGSNGLESWQRQALQVRKVRDKDPSLYIDSEGLLADFSRWIYPLHFIDFETSQVAIPFGSGRRPYEQVAFQFSHHRLFSDGRIEHSTEYLDLTRGKFPSFDFVRALKTALSDDRGTIFRYSPHENVVLCQIHEQLQVSQEPDRLELCRWIESVSTKKDAWKGQRTMVDLLDVVLNRYYNPATNGSNSLKSLLPAVLESSKYLRQKYSQPLYGSTGGILSRNFRDWRWIQEDSNGKVLDPYKLLGDGEIANGGAAMTAYARTQFENISDDSVARISKSLLKYCELDTFAMVLVYEHLADEIGWWKT